MSTSIFCASPGSRNPSNSVRSASTMLVSVKSNESMYARRTLVWNEYFGLSFG